MEQSKILVGTLMLKSKGWKLVETGEVNVETRFALKGTRHTSTCTQQGAGNKKEWIEYRC